MKIIQKRKAILVSALASSECPQSPYSFLKFYRKPPTSFPQTEHNNLFSLRVRKDFVPSRPCSIPHLLIFFRKLKGAVLTSLGLRKSVWGNLFAVLNEKKFLRFRIVILL